MLDVCWLLIIMDSRLIIAVCSVLVLGWIAVYPVLKKGSLTRAQWWVCSLGFFIVLGMALPAWRWRSLMYNGEINVDEGTGVAMGLKYLYDPIPWRSVDGITCGPLSTWVTLWPPLIGHKLSYFSFRVTGLFLIFAAQAGVTLSLREIVGRRFALMAGLPALMLLLTSLNFDFVCFALEYLPMAMSVWAIFLILSYYRSQHWMKVLLIGTITGAMPFSKLQSAPSAIVLFLISAGIVFVCQSKSNGKRINDWLWLAVGGLLVPTLILVPVIMAGAWLEFLNFYLFCGASYKSQATSASAVEFLLRGNGDFAVYLVAVLVASGLFCLFLGKKRALLYWGIGFIALAGYSVVLLFSVLRSGFNFPHYLLLLVMPLVLILGWALRALLFVAKNVPPERRRIIGGVILGGVLVMQAGNIVLEYSKSPQLLRDWGTESNPVVPILLRYSKPGDSMAVWGWANKLHAFTGLRPATRFVGTSYVTDPSPNYNRHRELFLVDIKKDRPKLFVDAVDEFRWPTWPPGAQARHDMLPELSAWVRREYKLVADVQTAPNKLPVRVYVRNEP
jgi:hypothetical protein